MFDSGVLQRLALIALGRASGFSLDEIALMFAPDGRLRIDRQMLAVKAEELDRTIGQLPICTTACGMPLHAVRRATWNVPLFGASCGPRGVWGHGTRRKKNLTVL
jgi:hypothetical protein